MKKFARTISFIALAVLMATLPWRFAAAQDEPTDAANVRHFGAVGDGRHDDTAAVLAAAEASDKVAKGHASVYFPCGTYAVHELDFTRFAPGLFVYASKSACAELVYNGQGGGGSYLMQMGTMAFGGLQGLFLTGYDAVQPAGLADTLVKVTSNAPYIDEMAIFRDLMFHYCVGDAIRTEGNGYVNFHLDHLRFDAVGGYAIRLTGAHSMEARPFSMTRWTWDNALRHKDFKQALLAKGLWKEGTGWGRGVLLIENAKGMNIRLGDARIEMNDPVLPDPSGGKSLFFEEGTGPDGFGYLTLDNVLGFANPRSEAAMLSTTGKVELILQNSYLRTFSQRVLVRTETSAGKLSSSFSVRPQKACKAGDLLWNQNPKTNTPVGWVCVNEGKENSWHPFGRIEQ